MRKPALILVLALAGVGCNGTPNETADDAAADLIDTADKADGVIRPYGTYRTTAAAAGELTAVVIKTDKTFHRDLMVYCFAAPCDPIGEDGSYTWSKSGSTRYIRFLDANGELIDRHAYELIGDTLKLRAAGTPTWVVYARAADDDAWCGAAADCEVQDLAQPRCPGQWACSAEDTCSYACGWPCEVAGGACVGLAPGNCADGEIGDAATYGCGGTVGVMCCLPRAPQSECESQGGSCVALTATSCGDGIPTGADGYSCGGMLGVTCCLPYSACAPVCDAIGSRSEGWYNPCTGELLCWANCAEHVATCGAIGSRSEGWYSTDDAGCNGSNLIGWATCSH